MSDLDQKLAVAVSRAITRRGFMHKTMRWTLAAGIGAATSWRFMGAAAAGGCQPGGTYDRWGCYCAGTMGCGADKCCPNQNVPCCNGAQGRCDFWRQSPYCWCSLRCCVNGKRGYYSCCDCWKFGRGSSGCGSGNTKCVCKHRHITSNSC